MLGALMLAAMVSAVPVKGIGPKPTGPASVRGLACANSPARTCGGWLLVYRWVVNIQEDFEGTPIYITREGFDWRRFDTEEDAYLGAEALRQTGVRLPGLARFGRESNIMPESITPMPHLVAVQAGIRDVREER